MASPASKLSPDSILFFFLDLCKQSHLDYISRLHYKQSLTKLRVGGIRGKWRSLSPPHAETQGRERRLDGLKGEMACGEAPFSGVCSGLEQVPGPGTLQTGLPCPPAQGLCRAPSLAAAPLKNSEHPSFSPLVLESTGKEGRPCCPPGNKVSPLLSKARPTQ